MTTPLFRDDAYLTETRTTVVGTTPEGGIICADSVFYPTGGGQPGDGGKLVWSEGEISIGTTIKGEGDQIILVPAVPGELPKVGTEVTQKLDWSLRHGHMRVHTALHLLSVVVPLPVTGGSIGAQKGRLDFHMEHPPEDKLAIEDALNALIEQDLVVQDRWISDADLAANPALVKTMSVAPPKGQGEVRLVQIGQGADQVDLQPCGGTHVARTAEIGRIKLGKVEKKGRLNRRISILLD